jgi:hypothetical protein
MCKIDNVYYAQGIVSPTKKEKETTKTKRCLVAIECLLLNPK